MVITALGSIVAYGREALLAATFGVSGSTDAYFAAIFIPFSLYSLLGAGALNPVVVPVLAEHIERGPSEDFWRIASTMLNLLVLALGGITVVGILLAPQLLQFLAPGFEGETLQVAVRVLRVSLPMTLLAGLAAYLAAVLNALGSFALPALNTVIISTCVVLATVLSGTAGIVLAATGWTIGSGLYLVLLLVVIARKHPRYHFSIDLRHPAVRRAGRLVLPMALFMMLAQVVPLAQRSLATYFPAGDLSRLNYASRLATLPNTVFTASLALVLLSTLSQQVAAKRSDAADESLKRALHATSFFLFPAAILFLVNRDIFVRLMFERGQFSALDSVLTGQLLAILALSIIPLGLNTILHDAFYSQARLWSLVWLGLLNTLIALLAMVLMQQFWGVYGIATAFTVSQVLYLAMLIVTYRSGLGQIDLLSLGARLLRVGAAAIVMGVVLFVLNHLVSKGATKAGIGHYLVVVAFGGVLGASIYLLSARMLRVPEALAFITHTQQMLAGGKARILRARIDSIQEEGKL